MKYVFAYLGIDIYLSDKPISKTHWLLHQNEFWKDVAELEGIYQVSSLGRCRSLNRSYNRNGNTIFIKGKVLKMGLANGYKKAQLYNNGVCVKREYLHRLICISFKINNIDNKPEVNHKNGNKLDNRLFNLEWVTKSENLNHAYLLGLHLHRGGGAVGEHNREEFAAMIKSGIPHKEVAKYFGVDLSKLYKLKKRYGIAKGSFEARHLSIDQVKEIRSIHNGKRSGYAETAILYGVSKVVIAQVVRRQSYKDIE